MDSETERQKKLYVKMTEVPVEKLLVGLSIPTIISMMVSNIYNLVDTAFVGTLGTSESGATGVVFGFMTILQAVAFMCGQGAGSNMSRCLGEKDVAGANRYASTGFFLSFSIGALIALVSFIFMQPLLFILGSTGTIAPHAGKYIFWILVSAPFFTSSLTMNNLLRYEGKARLGTIGIMTGAVLNILCDAVFMFVLKMGISGAGLATALSQFTSFCILLSMFLCHKTQTKISVQYISRNFPVIFNVMATGFPSLLRQSLHSVATMLLNGTAGFYGDSAVSAMSIVSRISFFPLSVAIGIGQGFQPISAFNYGAKKYDRLKRAFWCAFAGAEAVLALLSVPIFIFAPALVQQLRNDAAVIETGTRALRLMCVAQIFLPLTMMVEMGFQSIGEKLMASLSSSLRSGIIFIPMLIFLSRVRGLSGIQEAQPLSFVMTFILTVFLCRIYLKKLNAELK